MNSDDETKYIWGNGGDADEVSECDHGGKYMIDKSAWLGSLRYDLFKQLVNQIYPMVQYFLPRGGQSTLPCNLMTWVFEEFRTQPTSCWEEDYGNALLGMVSRSCTVSKVRW